jgi:hypothetical protein
MRSGDCPSQPIILLKLRPQSGLPPVSRPFCQQLFESGSLTPKLVQPKMEFFEFEKEIAGSLETIESREADPSEAK